MLWVLDDSENKPPSPLFKTRDTDVGIRYANGYKNLPSTVKGLLQSTEEVMVVYQDIVPENKWLIPYFEQLVELHHEYPARVFPVPIPCSEYFYLLSLPAQVYTTQTKLGLSKDFYSLGDNSSFETLCKQLLGTLLISCAKITKRKHIMPYILQDCECEAATKTCTEIPLPSKQDYYVSKFPVTPYAPFGQALFKLPPDMLKQICNITITFHNKWLAEHAVGELLQLPLL